MDKIYLEKNFKRFKNVILRKHFKRVKLDGLLCVNNKNGKLVEDFSNWDTYNEIKEVVLQGTLSSSTLRLRDWIMLRFARWVYQKCLCVEWIADRKVIFQDAIFDFDDNDLCRYMTRKVCIWSHKRRYREAKYIPFWLIYHEYLLPNREYLCLTRWKDRLFYDWRKKANVKFDFNMELPSWKWIALEIALEFYFDDNDIVLLRNNGIVEVFFLGCNGVNKEVFPVKEYPIICEYLIDGIIPFNPYEFIQGFQEAILFEKTIKLQ